VFYQGKALLKVQKYTHVIFHAGSLSPLALFANIPGVKLGDVCCQLVSQRRVLLGWEASAEAGGVSPVCASAYADLGLSGTDKPG